MWEKVGLVRSRVGLRDALASFDARGETRALSSATRNLLTVARLVATAALVRRESRGAHFRSDHPAVDPAWRRRIRLRSESAGIRLEAEPVADAEPVEVCA